MKPRRSSLVPLSRSVPRRDVQAGSIIRPAVMITHHRSQTYRINTYSLSRVTCRREPCGTRRRTLRRNVGDATRSIPVSTLNTLLSHHSYHHRRRSISIYSYPPWLLQTWLLHLPRLPSLPSLCRFNTPVNPSRVCPLLAVIRNGFSVDEVALSMHRLIRTLSVRLCLRMVDLECIRGA